MEENQKSEESVKIREEIRPMCANHPIMKSLLIGLLIFLGAFCAFYVVADWHLKSLLRPAFSSGFGPSHRRIEHMMKKEMRAMDKMLQPERKIAQKTGNIIHLQQSGDFYKISIDLRAFDNNENNVQVTTNGNILTINGRSIRKSKNDEQISEFQQNYLFGDNVKLSDLTKETQGNHYIITIPIGDND